MASPVDFNKRVDSLHEKVLELSKELPSSLFGRVYRYLTSPSLADSNKKVSSLVNLIALNGDQILAQLPEDLRNVDTLCAALKESNFTKRHPELPLDRLELFCTDMNKVFKEIYPLVANGPFSKEKKMPKKVQEFFSKELGKLRLEKSKFTGDESVEIKEEHKLDRKIAKGELAISLGQGFGTNKGASGAMRIMDINGKPVGIYKVSEKDVPIITRLTNIIKSIFGQLSYLSRKYMAQPRSERAAYLLSREFGFNLAPPSKSKKIDRYEGVFQIFITRPEDQGAVADVKAAKVAIKEHLFVYPIGKELGDYVEAKDVLDQIEAKGQYSIDEQTLFQKFTIFDYLIGNLDRHEENWFLALSTKGEIIIKAIDNANAFPRIQPSKRSVAARNQYKWKTLKLAQQAFTPEAVKFVNEKLQAENIQNFIEILQKDMPESQDATYNDLSNSNHANVHGFLEADMEKLLRDRASVILHFVNRSKTPFNLAAFSTTEEIQGFLETLKPQSST